VRRGIASARRFALTALVAVGCTTSLQPGPNLGDLYGRAARAGDTQRNPIIVIPGVLGTVLRDTESGRIVWGTFVGTYADPRERDGARLVALPMHPGVPLAELRDGVVPGGVLESVRVSLLGLPVEQHAYIQILRTLGAGGYRDQSLGEAGAIDYGKQHFTCFQFAYDWRRDNVENARRLHAFILEKKAYVEAELRRRYGIERDVRFDVVAHSMGGLLAHYYLRYGDADLPADGSAPPITWAGARHVARLVMVGTPNAGSLAALRDLVEGTQLAFFLPRYPPAVLGTMPSIYQLLPRARHRALIDASGHDVDLFDAANWERFGWGLAAPAADPVLEQLLPDEPSAPARRAVALDHLRKALARAQRFHAALDAPARPPPGTTLHLFAGDAVATPAVMQVGKDGALQVIERRPGDATVLRSSAVMDERVGSDAWALGVETPLAWSDVTFIFADHLGLTRDSTFSDNVLWRLLEAPR
jgi:pimeloyl-ACP methyl ester carboxylesterase